MSTESSATSTSGPSPEKIGKSFIKMYYNTLLTCPSQLSRLYQSDSVVSRGMEPCEPTVPSSCAGLSDNGQDPGERVRQAFFEWAGEGISNVGDSADILRIDFEHGAIDAQESLGGGILLVVTGHMYLPKSAQPYKPMPFVQTFFLNNGAAPGKKKQFYVKNDILRFLLPVEERELEGPTLDTIEGSTQTEAELNIDQQPVREELPLTFVQEPVEIPGETMGFVEDVVDYYTPAAEEEKIELVKEFVEAVIHEEQPVILEEEKIDGAEAASGSAAASPTSDGNKRNKRSRRKKGGKSSRSNSPRAEEGEEELVTEYANEENSQKPKTPGSWASLVATGQPKKSDEYSGGRGKGRKAPIKSRHDDKPTATDNEVPKAPPQDRAVLKDATPSTSTSTTTAAPQSQTAPIQRTPEATLFIRNIPDSTTEPEIRALFEPFGVITGNKILGITLNTNRGFCFVDFDGTPAVEAVVSEAEKSLMKDPRTGRKVSSSFMAHGRVLDVERKVKADANKNVTVAGGGGYNRRHSSGRSGMRKSPPRDGGGDKR